MNETRRAGPFLGNGVTTVFPFEMRVMQASDVVVTHTDVTGVDVVLGGGFTVTVNPDQGENPGGFVTLSVAPETGEKITLTTDAPSTQEKTFSNNGFFPAELNEVHDRLTVLVQQVEEKVDRAIKLPVSVAGFDTQLPLPVADNAIGYNSTGDGLANIDIPEMRADIARSLKYPAGEAGPTTTLPPKTSRPNTALTFDANGELLLRPLSSIGG